MRMKKTLSLFLVAVLLFLLLPLGNTARALGILMGDVNGDGAVNMGDVTKVYSCSRCQTRITGEYAVRSADANGDGKINLGDVGKIYAAVRGYFRLGTLEVKAPSERYILNLGDTNFGRYQQAKETMSIGYKLSQNLGCETVMGAFNGTRASTKLGTNNEFFSGEAVADAIATGNWSLLETGAALYTGDDYRYYADTVRRLKAVDYSCVTDITLNYGGSDWSGNASLYTYRKALRYVIRRLQDACPNAQIHVISVINRFFKDDTGAITIDGTTKQNYNGNTMCDFVWAAQQVAKEYNVNFINLFDTVNFTLSTRSQYYGNSLVNPDDNGNIVLAKTIGDSLFYGGKAYSVPSPKSPYKPSFAWIDDDGKGKVTYLYDWALENQVPFTCAMISGKIDVDQRWLTSDQIRQMYASGMVRFASHTVNHVKLSDVDSSVVEEELVNSKAQIEGVGVPCDFIVYPKGSINTSDLSLTEKYYPYGFAAGGTYGTNGLPNGDRNNLPGMNYHQIKRVAISGALTEKNGGYDYLKAQIDDAIATNGMLVFMSHVGSTSNGSGGYLDPQRDLEVYTWAVDYIRQCGYDIEPAITVCDRFAGK